MSEEKANNIGWREQLHSLDAIPGEQPVNIPAQWDKLQNRLEPKKEKKIAYWYWVAAASLIIVFSIPFIKSNRDYTATIIPHKKSNELIKSLPNQNSQLPTDKSILVFSKPEIHLPKKSSSLSFAKNKIHRKLHLPNTVDQTPLIIPENLQSFVPDTMVAIQSPPVKPVVKKLRVIHINELSNPVGEQQIMVRNIDLNAGRPSYRDNFSRMRLTNNSSDDLLKINLTPSN